MHIILRILLSFAFANIYLALMSLIELLSPEIKATFYMGAWIIFYLIATDGCKELGV